MARLPGQGYASPEDIEDEITDEAWRDREVQKRIGRWIAKWSDTTDDLIRSKYKVPFPDHPYSPGLLRQVVTYFVTHQIYVFEGMSRANSEGANQDSYEGMAYTLIQKILDGTAQLPLSVDIPTDDGGTRTVTTEISGQALYGASGTNPMSLENQNREFGAPVQSRRGLAYGGRLSDGYLGYRAADAERDE